MAITISSQTYDSLFEEMLEQVRYPDPEDAGDLLIPLHAELGRGQTRDIELREGLILVFDHFEQFNDIAVLCGGNPEPDCVRIGFHLSGVHDSALSTVCPGEYSIIGNGETPQFVVNSFAETLREVSLWFSTDQLRSFFGELPVVLQPLVAPDQRCFAQTYSTTSAIQVVLQQMLHCPYHGILKQRYLEAKVWELLVLVVEPLLTQAPLPKKLPTKLKSEQVDRIHAARKILLQRLQNPPSLSELARLVELNDCTLKQGFKQVFGTTTFNYLHHYRLEQAQQLLLVGDLRTEEVAQQVGFTNRSYFAKAFRKKFGVNPGEYSRQHRQNRLD